MIILLPYNICPTSFSWVVGLFIMAFLLVLGALSGGWVERQWCISAGGGP
jgi:hypothetical protein